ncbi:MAG: outer membrane lipoprotein carrier protein LolA [Rhizomicrobium sp.]|jgi:outer membrane lipoprotein-sorting protein
MRRVLLVVAASALSLSLGGAVPDFRHEMSDRDKADLDRVSAYLNSIHTMKAAFEQRGPDGQVDEGMFYIEKPGRMRFQYAAPNPTLVVSDGSTVAVQNRKLDTVDRYPIWSTPLSLILSDDVNLKKNPEIAGVDHQPGELIVDARSHSSKMNGNITLVFVEPTLELRQWTVVDAQGLATTVTISDVKQGVALDPTLFEIPQTHAARGG